MYCGAAIEMSNKLQRWLPFDENGNIHNCPRRKTQ
jgi:hypothetical protein